MHGDPSGWNYRTPLAKVTLWKQPERKDASLLDRTYLKQRKKKPKDMINRYVADKGSFI